GIAAALGEPLEVCGSRRRRYVGVGGPVAHELSGMIRTPSVYAEAHIEQRRVGCAPAAKRSHSSSEVEHPTVQVVTSDPSVFTRWQPAAGALANGLGHRRRGPLGPGATVRLEGPARLGLPP